jgi:hypothetical protein
VAKIRGYISSTYFLGGGSVSEFSPPDPPSSNMKNIDREIEFISRYVNSDTMSTSDEQDYICFNRTIEKIRKYYATLLSLKVALHRLPDINVDKRNEYKEIQKYCLTQIPSLIKKLRGFFHKRLSQYKKEVFGKSGD